MGIRLRRRIYFKSIRPLYMQKGSMRHGGLKQQEKRANLCDIVQYKKWWHKVFLLKKY